ncbi:MAG: DUF3795 domain-containing protein [Desulfocapsa sp.]|nr:DUF3795 domain-containing protein [Desulfocapsa sp.]
MDYKMMTAPCGIDCFNCALYAAETNEKLRVTIAERMGISPELARCGGCRQEKGKITAVGLSAPCKVFSCISAKGLDLCCECSDFPCDNLHPYADKADSRPHNTKVFNLCLIKKMGWEKWATEKAKSVRNTYFKGELTL